MPDGWGIKRLDSLCALKGGKRLPIDCELLGSHTTHPYIRVRDIGKDKFVYLTNQFEYIDEATHSAISQYIVKTNDIVITIVGTIGLIGIIHESLNNANLTENCVRLTDINTITADYLYHTLCYKRQKKELELLTVGAVQSKLPLYNIQSIQIVIPPLDVIQEFQRQIESLNCKIQANMIEIQELTKFSTLFLAGLSD